MSQEDFRYLCKQLTNCHPLFMSFLPGCHRMDISYCPFGKQMKGWRDTFLSNLKFDETDCCKCKAQNSKGIFNHLNSKAKTCPYHRAAACYMDSYLGNSGIHHSIIYEGKATHHDNIRSANLEQHQRRDKIIEMVLQNKHNFDVINKSQTLGVESELNETAKNNNIK